MREFGLGLHLHRADSHLANEHEFKIAMMGSEGLGKVVVFVCRDSAFAFQRGNFTHI